MDTEDLLQHARDTLLMASQLIDNAWRQKWGGASDATALALIGAGAACTSPGLMALPWYLPGVLAGAGMGYVTYRILESIRNRNVLGTQMDIRSSELPCHEDDPGIMLGYTTDDGRKFRIPDVDIMRHILIVGQSGVGKTVAGSLMLLQQIQRGGGLLFIDAKVDKDNLDTVYQMAAWCGRENDVRVIHPDLPELSNTYNPILYGDASEKASTILTSIPSSENNAGTDYYRQSANQGLRTLIGTLQRLKLAYSFLDLSILLTNPRALQDLERRAHQSAPNAPETIGLSLFLEHYKAPARDGSIGIDMKRLKETFGGVGGRMHTFGTDNFGKIMNTYSPEVRLFEDIRENKIIYIGLPTMGKPEEANNFGKLLIGDLRTAVAKIQKLPSTDRPNPPFLCFLDEAGSYATPALARLFEQARSANMIMMPAVQTLANFEAVSPEFAAMAIGNTWTKIMFKLGEFGTAETASKMIGMKKQIAESISHSDSSGGSKPGLFNPDPEGSHSGSQGLTKGEREEEVAKVTPDQLMALDKGECVVTFGGSALYNLRVPMIRFDKPTLARLGGYKLNRIRRKQDRGIDLYKESHRYITRS